ncbi:MAG: hypothetical protein GY760_13280 [Deltaproteobacteria bacterium]|jgi:hypothetical protein|nr:hypothetical protein [Deltaproteobacteria bacterium]|tara:strand:- start:226 stop:558 length:333 start_codon:yes stop_codon:yes gene_type:complete
MEKQSFDNTVYKTGAQRDGRHGKLRLSLVPHEPLKRVMKRYLDGANTYGENNWMKGMNYSVYYDSAMRHLFEFWEGRQNEDHLAAAVWNIFALMQENKNKSLDDRDNFPN